MAVFLASLAACQEPPDCFRADVFCAALVTDTLGIADHGINQETWTGLEQAHAAGLADHIAHIESVDARDYEKNISYFSERGYDLIVTSGIALLDETLRAADLYPDSIFMGINHTQTESRPNLICVTFPEDQMGFAAGVLAARLTKTGVVAGVCETSGIDAMWRYCEGFRAGAIHADQNVKILISYRDDGDREKLFVDEAWGNTEAQKLIFRGADVVFAVGGVTAQGALRAASEAGVHAIGAERDQRAALAESGSGVAVSLVGRAGLEVQEAMRLLRDGQVSEARTGQILALPSEDFPENLENELNSTLFALWSGDNMTNVTRQKP